MEGAGAPNENGEGWLKVDGLLGADPVDAGWPNGFEAWGAPKLNELVGAVVDVGVGVVPNPKPPPDKGRCASSVGFA